GEHARAQTDQAARGDRELQVNLALSVVHANELALAVADQLHDAAHVLLGDVDDEILDRLEQLPVLILAHDHVRLADAQFVSFATHVLNENAQVQEAATADLECAFVFRFFDLQRDVRFELLHQPLAKIAAGDVFALFADEGRRVDAEHHGQRGRLNLFGLERLRVVGVADRVGNVDALQPDQRDDVARGGVFSVLAPETVEYLQLLQ